MKFSSAVLLSDSPSGSAGCSEILPKFQADSRRRRLSVVISALLLSGGMTATVQAGADGFQLADLNGANGFRLDGETESDRAGFPVSAAGDINGDGFDDVLIGARNASRGEVIYGGGYVVFGKRKLACPRIPGSS